MLEQLQAALQDRYRIEREAGAGGMATVFVATDRKHQRRVALKVLRPELAAAVGPDRFLREIEIAARLQHPHIVPVYDSGQADGLLYYVMPFVEGETLRDRLQRSGPLTPADAVRLVREVADALAYAHREGIVHRDIKPANILISQGHAMVADFGIARAVTASAQTGQGLTQAGMAIGTPAYMSPEQALGDANVDGRTDVYSLGIVLYEMVAGNPPFVGTTPQAILGQTLRGAVPRLARDPLGLQRVIEGAMAREPAGRLTAEALAARLDAVLTGSGPTAALTRRRGPVLGAAALVLVAILAFALWPRGYRTLGDPRQSLIVFPFDNKTGDDSRDYLGEASMNLLGLAAAHWRDMRVYDDERTASLMRRHDPDRRGELDFEEARVMAQEARVGTVVVGDLRREGDSLAIEAKVHDVGSGDRLQTVTLRAGWHDDPRPLFDALAARILGTSGAPPGERPSVLAQTTTSIEAYRAYLAGTGALQRFQIDSARTLLGRAVTLDSGFALAYIRLRDAEGWGATGDTERRRQYILAAERHSASLPPRLKSLVQYHRAYMDGDYQRARGIAGDMIRRDSTDVEAWYQLGEAHYHHRALDYPHPDTLGNLGLALHAFQRTRALDSTYVLAYQHIIDALTNCAQSPFRICIGDSAFYGTPEELERRFGRATLERERSALWAAQLAAARAWVDAVPGSSRPRQVLLSALYTQKRFDEALAEAEAMDGRGWRGEAGMLKGMIRFTRGQVDEAATAVHDGLAATVDTLQPFAIGLGNWMIPPGLLAAAGRFAEARRLVRELFERFPGESLGGPGGLRMATQDLGRLADWYMAAQVGSRQAGPGHGSAYEEMHSTIVRYARGDTAALRRLNQSFGVASLSVYLATRDTNLLKLVLMHVDTLGSATWRVADAHLALARGDTARARLRVERHYRRPAESEFSGEQGVIRAYAWGDLLARLRQREDAIHAFARLDTMEARINHPGFVVRSWAERAALHQALGQTADALRDYQRFVDAWRHAEPDLQPVVERARLAVATLKGEARTTGDDPP